MDNLKSPAYPGVIANEPNNINNAHQTGNYEFQAHGFTKLELASLMIAQGALSSGKFSSVSSFDAHSCVILAKSILEEANK